MNTTFRPSRVLCALLLTGLAGAASATLSKPVYNTAKDEVKAMYKAERDKCDSLAGNLKDVCVERAKGQEKVALANLEYQYTGKDKDRNDYLEARYEARYKVAKEMCDDKAGNAKDVCVAEAKAAHDRAKANLKANKAVASTASGLIQKPANP